MATGQAQKQGALAVSALQQYQRDLRDRLAEVFRATPVDVEWRARVEFGGRSVYSPRLDVAVGPFAIEENREVAYDGMVNRHRNLLERLFDAHRFNLVSHDCSIDGLDVRRVVERNRNARCFLAVEIENQVSRKHLMGGAINAAALGRVGIAVGWSDRQVNSLIRLRSYLLFLARVGKNAFDPANLLILGPDQLMRCLATPRRRR